MRFFSDLDDEALHKLQQSIKWIIYALLIVNFVFYIVEDIRRASFTLHAESTLLQWTSAFATSIDLTAWFILLAMYEIETYMLEDEDLQGSTGKILHGVRLICILMIAHTIYAFSVIVSDLRPTIALEDINNACDLVPEEVSFVYNLEYTDITADNCSTFAHVDTFYRVGNDPVVSDRDGLQLERDLGLADLVEAITWILVLVAIELTVRLQSRGITTGTFFSVANTTKLLLYSLLIGLGIYWASLSHWLYLWDELLWIGGFAAIEMNLSDWREEIAERAHTT